MKVHTSLGSYIGKSPVVTMGTFDGVHPGHRELLKRVCELAREEKTESMVVTFWPHPRLVLEQDPDKLRLLTTLDEKISLIEKCGIDHLMVLPFTKEFSTFSARSFTERVLVDQLGVQHLVVGFDHRFGSDGITFDELKEIADRDGFQVSQFYHVAVDGGFPSSTLVRDHLLKGDIHAANHLLGYSYTITGLVGNGKKLGRTISYPTANVEITEKCKLIPLDGVYACRVLVDGKLYDGMVNIGVRPTVSKQLDHRTVEVHILDFSEDIYGEEISVYFEERVRDEMKFSGVDALKSQLEKDEKLIRSVLDKIQSKI